LAQQFFLCWLAKAASMFPSLDSALPPSAGITGVARTMGAAISPLFVGFMFARPSWINVPFFLAGVLKILYDLLLYKEFVSIRPVEERPWA
jgi:uncharacterized membrane-anchored protein YitT (DUF2179 family)